MKEAVCLAGERGRGGRGKKESRAGIPLIEPGGREEATEELSVGAKEKKQSRMIFEQGGGGFALQEEYINRG